MIVDFFKYQGAGNDFIIMDDRKGEFDEFDNKLISRLCNRRFGVGADGLMLLRSHPDFDFEMLYFNADGHLGSMCGNGGRCIVAFAHHLGVFKEKSDFLAVDGSHHAVYNSDTGLVKLGMTNVDQVFSWQDDKVSDTLTFLNTGVYLNTGSPHLIIEVPTEEILTNLNVAEIGSMLRNHPSFAESGGINVNFVAPKHSVASKEYRIRTFERGVEAETLACGTGATAVALAMAFKNNPTAHESIQTPVFVEGGELRIHFQQNGNKFTEIYLEGPAMQVFRGQVYLDNLSTNS